MGALSFTSRLGLGPVVACLMVLLLACCKPAPESQVEDHSYSHGDAATDARLANAQKYIDWILYELDSPYVFDEESDWKKEKAFFARYKKFEKGCRLDFYLTPRTSPSYPGYDLFYLDIRAKTADQPVSDLSNLGLRSLSFFRVPQNFDLGDHRYPDKPNYDRVQDLHSRLGSFIRSVVYDNPACETEPPTQNDQPGS